MRKLFKVLQFGVVLIAVASVSFYFFYKRAQKNLPIPLIFTSAVINQPLPKTNLVDSAGKQLDGDIRRGRVALVFTLTTCPICDQENDFLKTVVDARKDVSFFYVIPLGNKDTALKSAQSKYAFETLFDEGGMLSKSLEIYRVPLIVYLEDGIIKKTWLDGATVENKSQAKFKQWLTNL